MLRPNKIMFAVGRWSPRLAGFLLPRLIRTSLPSMEQHIQKGTSPSADLSPEVFAVMAADQREATFYPTEGHTDPLTRHIDEIMDKVLRAAQSA